MSRVIVSASLESRNNMSAAVSLPGREMHECADAVAINIMTLGPDQHTILIIVITGLRSTSTARDIDFTLHNRPSKPGERLSHLQLSSQPDEASETARAGFLLGRAGSSARGRIRSPCRQDEV